MNILTYIEQNDVQEIPFSNDFEDNTGYFDGVFTSPSVTDVAQVSYFVNHDGDHAILFLTNNRQGVVVHERFEDILVLTQSSSIHYRHFSNAIERLLSLPISDVMTSLKKGNDAVAFNELLLEKCFFDY